MKRPPESAISASDLRKRIAQLEQIVEQLTARLAELEQELARRKGRSRRGAASSESGASSSPRTDASRRRSSGRSPGAQPGHEGPGRSWVTVEQVDERIPVKPSQCHGCGHPLTGDDPHPQRHQEVVLPALRAEVIEYQLHTLRCAHCDRLTEAGWPEGVSRHTFGPSVQAWVGLLAGAYRMSKRNIQSLLSDAFGLEVSLGTVSRLQQEVAAALAGAVEEARAFVRRQPIVNVDETGWRQRRAKAWLWTAVTEGVTVFAIRKGRGRDGVDEVLGADTRAVVGSDRYSAYGHLPLRRRHVCWAHLRRTFEEFVGGRLGRATAVGFQRPGVWLVAPRPRRHLATVQLPGLRQRLAWAVSYLLGVWSAVRRRQDGGHLRQPPRPRAGPVDLRAHTRRRADQQRSRTSPSSWRAVASHQLLEVKKHGYRNP